MMRILHLVFLILLCSTSLTYAGIVVCRDSQTNDVLSFELSSGSAGTGCHLFELPGVSQTDFDNLKTLIKTVPKKYLKMTGTTITSVQEKTQAEKDSIDSTEAAANQTALTSTSRSDAKTSVDQLSPDGVRLRSALLVTLDEINLLRQWIASFKVEVASASNLADLKTRVASLPNMPDRTVSQMKTAIKNRIDAGDAD